MRDSRRVLGALLALFVAAALLAPVAAAQVGEGDTTQTTTGPSTTPTTTTTPTTPGPTDQGEEGQSGGESTTSTTKDEDSHSGLVVAALFFGFFVIVALLYYLSQVQGKYYRTSEGLVTLGKVIPTAISIAAIERDRDGIEVAEIKIEGPGVVVCGQAAQFKAMSGGAEQIVDWTVEHTDEGTGQVGIEPASGSHVQVNAAEAGSYKLIAKQGAEVRDEVVFNAVVPEPADQKSVGLPFVGEGYGTVVIAVVILTIAGALGFAGVLDTSAIATLLGAIAGYIFVQASGGSGDSSGSPPQAGAGTGT
jgi:hypothetical protein